MYHCRRLSTGLACGVALRHRVPLALARQAPLFGGGSRELCARCFCGGGSSELLRGSVDRFGGVTVTLDGSDVADLGAFRRRLRHSVSTWRAEGKCATWVHVPSATAAAVPLLFEQGFDWHHARPDATAGGNGGYALLALWLLKDEPSRLPLYASTQVGVGGLVLNEAGEVLLMQERVSLTQQVHGLWKLPGGLVDPGEDLSAAAAREVFEETGVRASAEGVLCIHHRHGFRHGVSDLYFTVRMRAAAVGELAPETTEARALTWMPLEEAQCSTAVMEFNRRILALANGPQLISHLGRHGSTSAKADYFLYAAASALDPATGQPKGS